MVVITVITTSQVPHHPVSILAGTKLSQSGRLTVFTCLASTCVSVGSRCHLITKHINKILWLHGQSTINFNNQLQQSCNFCPSTDLQNPVLTTLLHFAHTCNNQLQQSCNFCPSTDLQNPVLTTLLHFAHTCTLLTLQLCFILLILLLVYPCRFTHCNQFNLQ